ncbi:hypothetical protein D3C87_1407690 [compost metagenome]
MVQQGVGLAQHGYALDGVGRAGQTIVEHAQHVQVATLQRLLNQPLGIAGGADHDDIGRQNAASTPVGDQQAPGGVQA